MTTTETPTTGEINLFGHNAAAAFAGGQLEILSVGRGDWKILLDTETPEGIVEAKRVINDMMKQGYSLFVEGPKGLTRVKRFNAKHMIYVVSGEKAGAPDAEVPVAQSRTRAVGRTSGG